LPTLSATRANDHPLTTAVTGGVDSGGRYKWKHLLRDSFPLVRANASLIEAMESFSHHDRERLPVVSHIGTWLDR
jgi:hypothetical protein